jgi:hypothetical protein
MVAAALCTVAIAQPLQGQGVITASQTVSGRLDASDRVRDSDNTYYDDWFYVGRAGERITVTQRSSDFDSWLLIGRIVNGEFQLDEYNDDDGGGNDSRIDFTLPEDGPYVIRVNVVGRGRTGAYTLRVDRAGGGAAPRPTGGMVLSAGQSFTGALEPSDPLWTDDTHYDLWRYYGRAGERLTIIMRSPSFNSYMQYGRMNGNEFNYLGGSTGRTIGGQQETVLDVTLPETGEYGIRANSHGRHTGEYVLTVSSSGSAASTPTRSSSSTITIGSTIRGSLTPADVQTDSGWYHEDYTFSGSRGQVIQVDLQSDEFDTFIDLYQGTRWVAEDDDGGDGLDSRLVYTLPETGTYIICARSRYANRTGSYTLTLR